MKSNLKSYHYILIICALLGIVIITLLIIFRDDIFGGSNWTDVQKDTIKNRLIADEQLSLVCADKIDCVMDLLTSNYKYEDVVVFLDTKKLPETLHIEQCCTLGSKGAWTQNAKDILDKYVLHPSNCEKNTLINTLCNKYSEIIKECCYNNLDPNILFRLNNINPENNITEFIPIIKCIFSQVNFDDIKLDDVQPNIKPVIIKMIDISTQCMASIPDTTTTSEEFGLYIIKCILTKLSVEDLLLLFPADEAIRNEIKNNYNTFIQCINNVTTFAELNEKCRTRIPFFNS